MSTGNTTTLPSNSEPIQHKTLEHPHNMSALLEGASTESPQADPPSTGNHASQTTAQSPWMASDASSLLSSAPPSPVLPPSGTDFIDQEASTPSRLSRQTKSLGPETPSKLSRKRSAKVSPYFPTPPKEKVSCIPFPPLTSNSFGLAQESLAHNPFHLLIAVIFLNKTRGAVALPLFYTLISKYPTPAVLAAANYEDVVEIFAHLGLQNQRAKKCIGIAQAWSEQPPDEAKRYRRLDYPKKGDGRDIKPLEIIDNEDERVAWEVGNLPGVGAYAIDSWRIFCRDELRGLPTGLPDVSKGKLSEEEEASEMSKEWTRVLPTDKELRAYLRWRWLRMGWEWDPLTGERKRASEELMKKAEHGGVICEKDGDAEIWEGEERVIKEADIPKAGLSALETAQRSFVEESAEPTKFKDDNKSPQDDHLENAKQQIPTFQAPEEIIQLPLNRTANDAPSNPSKKKRKKGHYKKPNVRSKAKDTTNQPQHA